MKFLTRKNIKTLFLIIPLLVALILIKWAFLEQLDALSFDLALRLRGAEKGDSRIVIVAIDDGSLAEIGHWPWNQGVISRLFDRVLQSEPAVVGLDLLLPSPQTKYPQLTGKGKVVVGTALGWSAKKGGGQLFWQETSEAHPAVDLTPENRSPLPSSVGPGPSTLNDRQSAPPLVQAKAGLKPEHSLVFGHIHADKDIDGICRSVPLSVSYSGRRRWAFSLQLARLYLELPSRQLAYERNILRLGPIALPRLSEPIDAAVDSLGVLSSSAGDHLLINYRGGPRAFRYVAAADILSGQRDAMEQLRKRIVLVGATSYSLGDHLSTAFSAYNETPGVEIHANALDTILNRRFIRTVSENQSILLLSVLAIWTLSLFSGWPRRWTTTLIILTLVLVLVVPPLLLILGSLWVPWVTLFTAVTVPAVSAQLHRFITFNRRLNDQFRKLARLLLETKEKEVLKRTSRDLSLFRRQRLEWKLDVLGEASRRALRVAAVKEETLSFLSHELKTPLTSIRGFADLLLGKDQLTEEDRAVSLTLIRNESRRLNKLISDYLDLARLEHGSRSPNFESCTLNSLLADACPLVQPQLTEKQMRLEYKNPPETVTCYADPALLTQIAINLLSNAIKYSPPGTDITLALRADGDFAEITVKDRGYGISEQDLKQLFRKFFRGRQGSNNEAPGSGLGLAFVREVVQLHGGDIRVESEVGVGSTFSVRIPRSDAGRPESGQAQNGK